MTTFKIGGVVITYTPPKAKQYVAPVVVNSTMGMLMNKNGNISVNAMSFMIIMYIYKFVLLAKERDIGKLLDLTIKYSITIVCFYILPYIVNVASKGSISNICVKEFISALCSKGLLERCDTV